MIRSITHGFAKQIAARYESIRALRAGRAGLPPYLFLRYAITSRCLQHRFVFFTHTILTLLIPPASIQPVTKMKTASQPAGKNLPANLGQRISGSCATAPSRMKKRVKQGVRGEPRLPKKPLTPEVEQATEQSELVDNQHARERANIHQVLANSPSYTRPSIAVHATPRDAAHPTDSQSVYKQPRETEQARRLNSHDARHADVGAPTKPQHGADLKMRPHAMVLKRSTQRMSNRVVEGTTRQVRDLSPSNERHRLARREQAIPPPPADAQRSAQLPWSPLRLIRAVPVLSARGTRAPERWHPEPLPLDGVAVPALINAPSIGAEHVEERISQETSARTV
ncbi:MAG: hypothetical protein ACXV4B_03645, partial [Halobacteriota archaeon]